MATFEGDHEGSDEESLLKHKHCKIWQIPWHTSKIVVTNNLETWIPWYFLIQNGPLLKHGMPNLENLKSHKPIKNIQKTIMIK